MFSNKNSKQKSEALRKILDRKGIISMPGCFDALSAKLIELNCLVERRKGRMIF